jgi:hypothetical protein
MNRRLSSLIASIAMLVTVACGGGRRPPVVTPPPAQIFTLGVIVTGDGAALPEATIDVRDGRDAGLHQVTDGTGNAYFATLHVGGFNVCANAPGFSEKCVGVNFEQSQHVGIDLERHQLPPPPPPSGKTYVGQLAVEHNGGYIDALGNPVLFVGHHTGDFLSRWVRDPGGVAAELDAIKAAGYDGIRFWSTLGGDSDFWRGRGVGPVDTPNYWEHVKTFLLAVKERGLVVQLSQGDVRSNVIPNRQEFAYRMADVVNEVGPDVVALFEAANESLDTGEPDPEKLRQFNRWFLERCPSVRVNGLSSYTGTEDVEVLNRFSASPANIFIVHGYRGGRWFDKVRHIFSLQYEGDPEKRLGWQGEPAGPGQLVSAIDNRHELDADALTLMAAMALVTRQQWMYFSGPGVISNHPNGDRIQNMPGFREVPRVKSMLPADVMRYDLLTHGGTTWAGVSPFLASGENRADCAIYRPDGRFACVIYGEHFDAVKPNPSKRLEIVKDTRLGNKGRVVYGRMH